MHALLSMFTALVRPGRGLEKAGPAAKWLWIPLALALIVSVAIKVSVATPLQLQAQMAESEAQLQAEMEKWPEEERENYKKAQAEMEASGDFVAPETAADQAGGIAAVAALVFGVLGAAAAIVYIATFFFVAAKTWANPVKYTTMLTVAALSLVPHAIRNVVQALYMGSTGEWIAHSGLGALVAPPLGEAPGIAYALLGQIDIWVLWGLAILAGALLSTAVGLQRKKLLPAFVVFIAVTAVAQSLPTLVSALLMGAGA